MVAAFIDASSRGLAVASSLVCEPKTNALFMIIPTGTAPHISVGSFVC